MFTPQPSLERQLEVGREVLRALRGLIPRDALDYWLENPGAAISIVRDLAERERNEPYFRHLHTLTIEHRQTEDIIAAATEVFAAEIDESFVIASPRNTSMAPFIVEVHEQRRNGTLQDFFRELGQKRSLLSEKQIIEFCSAHSDKLHPGSYTLFMFSDADGLAVAGVQKKEGQLSVTRFSLEDSREWTSGPRMLFVVLEKA